MNRFAAFPLFFGEFAAPRAGSSVYNSEIKLVNSTGKNVIALSLADTRSENKVDSTPGEGGLPDGQSILLELPAMLEKNAPDVMFSFTVEGGDNVTAHINQKEGTVTMLIKDDGLTFEVSAPGK